MNKIEQERPPKRMSLLFKEKSTYDTVHKACHNEQRSVRFVIERAVREYFKLD